MPSFLHDALIRLFRDEPGIVPLLLRDVLQFALPDYSAVRVESADLTQIQPTEYRADLVVLLAEDRPALGVIVEAQLKRDPAKRKSWPVYVATVHARFGCPTCVLVVTPRRGVAAWARAAVHMGPGSSFEPIVLGPDVLPGIVDPESARRTPELAVLSAVAHGKSRDTARAVQIAFAALVGCVDLDAEKATFYADVVRVSLGKAARAALESLMQSPEHHEFQSAFARKYTAIGKTEGKTEGKAEGKAEALLRVLDRRGLFASAAQRRRVLGCSDLQQLDVWLDRAITATSADEVFG